MRLSKRIKVALGVALIAGTAVLAGCTSAADRTDENLDTAAENFEILRRVVFVNTITDAYMLEIQGYCNVRPLTGRIHVTCQQEEDEYVRHTIYSGDNTAVIVEQMENADVSSYHYRFIIRPETILPEFDIETSGP